MLKLLVVMILPALLFACVQENSVQKPETFARAVAFLQSHTDVIVLSDADGMARVAVLPQMQARVMTSTLAGDGGMSLGWINHELIASGKILPHMNPFGGEDRFWLGPEGGQYAIFFKPGDPFDLEHWQTPASIDTEPWEIVSRKPDRAVFRKKMQLQNYADFWFDLLAEREVRLLSPSQISDALAIQQKDAVNAVAFQSLNKITNTGERPWKAATGLLSIWILGMFNPSPATTVVIPFHPRPVAEKGPIVNDAYFGKVPADRLVVADSVIFFKGDGRQRGKIGLSPARAKPIIGSYDATNHVLTLVQYSRPEGATAYVNSMWELQEHPYAGDVVNSYNDGPPAPGAKPLGPFYELETSSPAAALQPGESVSHLHRTYHFQGDETALDTIARATLGVGIAEIKAALR